MEIKLKTRIFKDENYKAIYHNFQTLRMMIDSKKSIFTLKYPEFYDIKLTNYCSGSCNYCYQDSKENSLHYSNIIDKINDFFGNMNENQRPFQVALGGGNPNEHPNFINILKTFYDLGIVPNYTTNGIGMTCDVIDATKKYCGGVAITCHNHLENEWLSAIKICIENNIKTNFHILISSKKDVDNFLNKFKSWKKDVEYFVLLPLLPRGRAENVDYDLKDVSKYLIKKVEGLNTKQVAFGANFYPYVKNNKKLDLSLYEPEIFSAYIDLKNKEPLIYKSSFTDEMRTIG